VSCCYIVSVSEGYFQVGSFEKVSDFLYGRAVVCVPKHVGVVFICDFIYIFNVILASINFV